MTEQNESELFALNEKPIGGWDAAAAMGIDMSSEVITVGDYETVRARNYCKVRVWRSARAGY
jgi:hypothetical protein